MTVRIPIISTFNAKGIKDATKQFNKLGHSVNGALKIAAVEEFARRSIKAFAENQKGVALLTNTLKNLGQEFMAVGVVKFIDDLTLATGKTKEELIPAFQGLFIATGSVTKAQEALKLAMDVSAGTTKDLNPVQIALSKAYLGNTTSLTRLGAGLSKTLLKTGDMEKITAQLAATFKGNASVAADTFTGKLDRLKASINDAQEIIGGAMVDSLAKFAGTNGVGGAQKAVKGLGDEIGFIVTGIGDMAAAIKPLLPLLTAVGLAMLAISNPFTAGAIGIALVAGEAAKIKDRNYYAPKKAVNYGGKVGAGVYQSGMGYTRTPMQSPGDRAKIDAGNAKLAKAKKDELAMLTAKNKLTLAEATAKADQAKLDEQKKKFDLERIGIAAGIAQKEDELSKTKDAAGRALLTVELDRLKLQQAILDENAKAATAAADQLAKAEADKLKGEIAAADALAKLATNSGLAGSALGKLAGLAELKAGAATVVADTNKSTADLLAQAEAAAAVAEAAAAAGDAAVASTTGTSTSTGNSGNSLAAQIGEEISPILTEAPAAIAEVIAEVIPGEIAQVITPLLTEQPLVIAEIMAKVPAQIAEEISPILTEIPKIIDDSLRPGDFKPTNIADLPASTSGIDTQALADLFRKLNDFANGKDAAGNVTVTVIDKTSGLIEVVKNAVTDNNRYGNSMVPAGSLQAI